MPKKKSCVETTKSEIEIGASLDAYLRTEGFGRTGSEKKYTWRKGLLWTIFARFHLIEGRTHLEVWNYMPIPGMGSFLMFFMNKGKLLDLLEGMERTVHGNVVTGENARATESAGIQYAGFWKRFWASLIDLLLFYVIFGVFAAIFFGISGGLSGTGESGSRMIVMNIISIFFLIGLWLYFALMESSVSQATLGKKALGIRVTNIEGNRITFGKASGRFWGKSVSFFTFGIGFLITAFTVKKQALHDIMAKTLVIRC